MVLFPAIANIWLSKQYYGLSPGGHPWANILVNLFEAQVPEDKIYVLYGGVQSLTWVKDKA